MKVVKFTFKAVMWIAIVLVVALLALPLWIGPVGKGVANAVVPRITGTGFHLGDLGFNQYSGRVRVGDMQLENPSDFDEKNALELGKFNADVEVLSFVSGKKYHVESVELDGLVICTDFTASNFRQIAANASGEKAESPEAAAEAPAEPAPEETAAEAPAAEEGAKKGYQIDHIVVDNVTVKIGKIALKVPMKIEIDGIGADTEEGASLQEIVMIVYTKIVSAAGAVGGKFGEIGKGTADAVKNVDLSAAKKALDAGNLKGAADTFKDAGKSLKDAGDSLKSLFK